MRQHFFTHLPIQLNLRFRFTFTTFDFQFTVWILLQVAVVFGLNDVQAIYWYCLDKEVLEGNGRHTKLEDCHHKHSLASSGLLLKRDVQVHRIIQKPVQYVGSQPYRSLSFKDIIVNA